jgi:hypothetical protein
MKPSAHGIAYDSGEIHLTLGPLMVSLLVSAAAGYISPFSGVVHKSHFLDRGDLE